MPRRGARDQETFFPKENYLYCGDNLEVLKLFQPDESVDLIYLDPPFKHQEDYNVLFEELSGRRASAQLKAFADTWTWNEPAIAAFEETVQAGPGRLSEALRGLSRSVRDSLQRNP